MGKADDDARTTVPPSGDHREPGNQATRIEGSVRVETPTRRQLRLQQPKGEAVAPGSSLSLGEPLPGGRRDRRRQQTTQLAAVGAGAKPAAGASAATKTAPPAGDLSVEAALAARKAVAGDAGGPAAGRKGGVQGGAPGGGPFPDPAVLAQQKVLAERAAALGSRMRRTHAVAEQQKPASNDPTAPDNLSIVAPPEFVGVPGAAQAVLRAPSTSLIPVVLPKAQQRTGTESEDSPPLGARDAFGLEPLDAMTAGLGRLRRLRYIQYSLLGVGAAALVTGIIMTVSSLNG